MPSKELPKPIRISDVVGWRVSSLSDGNFLVKPFYDQGVWPMWEEDLMWRGFPGFITRLAIAEELEALLNGGDEDE